MTGESMKRTFVAVFAMAMALTAAEPKVNRALIASVEKSFDSRIINMWQEALAITGTTRGLYLEGYGVVITGEVVVATAPISMMSPTLTDKEKGELQKKKQARLPQLRSAIKAAAMDAAASFDPLPPTERVAFHVVLPRYNWEQASGIPLQIVLQATKQQLLDAKRTGNDSGLQLLEY